MAPDLERRSSVDAVLELSALDKRNWQRALQHILRVDARRLAVDRTSYWTLGEEPRRISCELGYVRSADAFEQGAVLLASDARLYMDAVDHAEIISIEDVSTDPRARDLHDYVSARDISSMLDVPVWVESRLAGVLCHEHVGPPRAWTEAEIDFAMAVAQTVATALEARSRTHAEEEARRAGLLSHASLVLSRSLDERVVAHQAVALALPALADWATVDIFDEDKVERVAIQHADPAKQKLTADYVAAYPPHFDTPHLTVIAHRLGQAVLVPEATDEIMRDYHYADDHIRRLRAVGLRSAMAVPLRVPGSIDAVMMFISAGRSYDQDALKFAEDFGERVAAALSNAHLYGKAKEALRARDDFLSLAAHELRTPFTSLRIACERLLVIAEVSPNPDIVVTSERILRQSRRLTRLVNRMLDASFAEQGTPLFEPQDVDLVPLVREVVDELRLAKNDAAIELITPPRVVGHWDGDRLQEVVSNLVENALKYGRDQPVRVTLDVDGDEAVLTVIDRGVGIDRAVLPRLFAPYERGAASSGYGGLGLGLYLAREIVDAHGGSLEVTSDLGVGSEFRVRLPGVLPSRTRDATVAPPPHAPHDGDAR